MSQPSGVFLMMANAPVPIRHADQLRPDLYHLLGPRARYRVERERGGFAGEV